MNRNDIFNSLSQPGEPTATREYPSQPSWSGWWRSGLDPVRAREFRHTTFSACFVEALAQLGPATIADALEAAAGELRSGNPAAVDRLIDSLAPEPRTEEPRTGDV